MCGREYVNHYSQIKDDFRLLFIYCISCETGIFGALYTSRTVAQNRRQKVFNRGDLRFCGRLDTLKIDKNLK